MCLGKLCCFLQADVFRHHHAVQNIGMHNSLDTPSNKRIIALLYVTKYIGRAKWIIQLFPFGIECLHPIQRHVAIMHQL